MNYLKTILPLFLLFSHAYLSAQNVGVGTYTPAEKLHVEGNLRVDGDTILGDMDKTNQSLNTITNGGIRFMLDNDNNGAEQFGLLRNGINSSFIFDVDESGNIRSDGNLLLNTSAGNLIEMAGSAPFLRATNAADILFSITGTGGIRLQLDSDNDNTSSAFSVANGTGADLLSIAEDDHFTLFPLGTGAGQTGGMKFRELTANGSHWARIKAPDALFASYTLTLPPDDGNPGQLMVSNGSGELYWVHGDAYIDRDWFVANTTAHPYDINDNIYTNGYVGIGTADPQGPLQIHTPAAGELLRINSIGRIKMEETKNTYGGLEWTYGTSPGDRYGIVQAPNGNVALYTSGVFAPSFISFNLANTAGTFDQMAKFTHEGDLQFQGSNRGITYQSKEYTEEWRLVYEDNFETSTEGWMASYTGNTGNPGNAHVVFPSGPFRGASKFLRCDNNRDVLKKYFDLSGITYSEVKVEFNYLFIGNWEDGEFGWGGVYNHESIYVEAPYSPYVFWNGIKSERLGNNTDGQPQFTDAATGPYWGPLASNRNNFYGSSYGDRIHNGESQFAWSGNGLWLMFGSSLNDAPPDEDFGIDNIRIYVR